MSSLRMSLNRTSITASGLATPMQHPHRDLGRTELSRSGPVGRGVRLRPRTFELGGTRLLPPFCASAHRLFPPLDTRTAPPTTPPRKTPRPPGQAPPHCRGTH